MSPAKAKRKDPDMAALAALAQIAGGVITQGGSDPAYGGLKQGLRKAMLKDPIDSLAVVVLGGAYLFYIAEKGKNPKVESYWDALTFISTCLSVGYHDVFARTDAGKAIASFVMTFGPALSGAALDAPAAEREAESAEALAVQKAILEKLDSINKTLASR